MATVEQADEMHEVHGHGPAPGETAEQHAQHARYETTKHWGMGLRAEITMFYTVTILSWCFEIASCPIGAYKNTNSRAFAATAVVWLVLWGWAWLQTATLMIQRASWVRDEANLKDRKQYLFLAVRLQRLMLPTAIIAFITFLVAYTRRSHYKDLAYWLVYLLFFIFNTVGCVMNAYNNITWECDRLNYEEGESPFKYTRLAILGIPSTERGLFRFD